jgi:Tfp pilus assembly protein PilN
MNIKYFLITAVLVTAIFGFGFVASAQTTNVQTLIAQLQAQIARLTAQLQSLQAQQSNPNRAQNKIFCGFRLGSKH